MNHQLLLGNFFSHIILHLHHDQSIHGHGSVYYYGQWKSVWFPTSFCLVNYSRLKSTIVNISRDNTLFIFTRLFFCFFFFDLVYSTMYTPLNFFLKEPLNFLYTFGRKEMWIQFKNTKI